MAKIISLKGQEIQQETKDNSSKLGMLQDIKDRVEDDEVLSLIVIARLTTGEVVAGFSTPDLLEELGLLEGAKLNAIKYRGY